MKINQLTAGATTELMENIVGNFNELIVKKSPEVEKNFLSSYEEKLEEKTHMIFTSLEIPVLIKVKGMNHQEAYERLSHYIENDVKSVHIAIEMGDGRVVVPSTFAEASLASEFENAVVENEDEF
jgi:hypothetical protein